RRLLFRAWPAPITNAFGKNRRESCLVSDAKRDLIVLLGDGLELTFEHVVVDRPACDDPRRAERRVQLVALSSSSSLGLDDALAARCVAGVNEIRRLGSLDLFHHGIDRR